MIKKLVLAALIGLGILGNPSTCKSYDNEFCLVNRDLRRSMESEERSLEIRLCQADVNYSLRHKIRNEISNKFPSVYAFGNYLDGIEERVMGFFDSDKTIENPDTTKYLFKIEVPKNFFVDEMDIRIHVRKKQKELYLYQNYNGKEILLLKTDVGVGGWHEDASDGNKTKPYLTPNGLFWIKRIVEFPWWLPPSWNESRKPVPPISINPKITNPYGNYMSELCRDSSKAGYELNEKDRDSGNRLHSSYMSRRFHDVRSTHGCVRMYKDVANEFFPATLHYLIKNNEPKYVVKRGTVNPLKKPIPFLITND